jgi:hypothetical protein
MSKKSLIFGSIVLLLAMVFALTGCDNPAGPEGPKGDPGNGLKGDQGLVGGGGLSGGEVRAVDLEEAFALSDLVIVQSNVTSIEGVVPAGKTLKILGDDVSIPSGAALELKEGAELIINEGAVLSAKAIPGIGGEGSLKAASTAKVTGKGAIVLPVDLSPEGSSYTGSLHWESSEVTVDNEYPGSWYPGLFAPFGPNPVFSVISLNSDAIRAIFETKDRNTLTVKDVPNLLPEAIPPNKTLTLVGTLNTITGNFLLANYAKLIVGEGGELEVNGELSSNSAAEFINEGKVDLKTTGNLKGNSGGLTNNGTIYTASTNGSVIRGLLGITATEYSKTATIVVREIGANGVALDTAKIQLGPSGAIPLNQNLVLAPQTPRIYQLATAAAPFTGFGLGGKPLITLDENAILYLPFVGTYPNNIATIGTTVKNEGKIITDTESFTALKGIFDNMEGIGEVEATGEVKLERDLSFKIPKGTELTLSGSTTFDSVGTGDYSPLIVEGSLTLSNQALAPKGNITVTGRIDLGTGSLTVAADQTLDISSSSAKFENDGTLVQATDAIVKIDGKTDYKFLNPIEGDEFGPALDTIKSIRNSLKDTLDLTSDAGFGVYYSGQKVIGTVDLSGGASSTQFGVIRYSATVNEGYITHGDPAAVTISATDLTVVQGTNSTNPFAVSGAFSLGVATYPTTGVPANSLGLQDSLIIPGGDDKYGVIKFNSYKITVIGVLETPDFPDLFHVAVKSKR